MHSDGGGWFSNQLVTSGWLPLGDDVERGCPAKLRPKFGPLTKQTAGFPPVHITGGKYSGKTSGFLALHRQSRRQGELEALAELRLTEIQLFDRNTKTNERRQVTITTTHKINAVPLEKQPLRPYYWHSLAQSANGLGQSDGPRTFRHVFSGERMMKIRPLHDRVVIKRVESEEKTASGIVLPGAAAEKPDLGEVVAIGTGKVLDNGEVRALSVKVGDKVILGKYSGQSVKVNGEELLVVREEDIFGVLEA